MLTLLTGWLIGKLRPKLGDKAEGAVEWIVSLGGLLAVALIVLAIVFGVRSCYIDKKVKEISAKVEAAKIEVAKAQSKVQQVEDDIEATEEEREAVREIAKEKEERLLEVIKEDSTSRPADEAAAWQRFCQLYPEDSKCI